MRLRPQREQDRIETRAIEFYATVMRTSYDRAWDLWHYTDMPDEQKEMFRHFAVKELEWLRKTRNA